MAKPQVYKLELKALKEPDDLWDKLFFLWLRSLQEQFDGSARLLRALEHALEQLDKAVSELSPEESDDLRTAIKAVQETREAWSEQSTRSLENTERLALVGKQIMASQEGA